MLKIKFNFLLISLVIVIATLCTSCSTNSYAPVNNGAYPLTKSGYYRVRRGDTLYSIAFAYGYDYRKLAKLNGIKFPYHVNAGRLLFVRSRNLRRFENHRDYYRRRSFAMQTSILGKQNLNNNSAILWGWPVTGKILNYYAPVLGNKGINISGRLGQPIMAAAAGTVVYAGTGLRAYGQLIIIKHNNAFLSAYAHNQKIFVTEGQLVQKGQKIALMGNTGTTRPMLHFEIRKAGQSVNPLTYLPIK